MSLASFQRALSDLTASPARCREFRSAPDEFLRAYDLSRHEQQRLSGLLHQRGLATQCGLYRANRITPVYTLLPLTCVALGDSLKVEVEAFWADCEDTDLQFKQEISRFAAFLKARIQKRVVTNSFVEEVLDFELAANTLRFLPRQRIKLEFERADSAGLNSRISLHPLLRTVAFRHNPSALLKCLNALQGPPDDLLEGEFYLLLDATSDELVVKQINPILGRLLAAIECGAAVSLPTDDLQILIDGGFVIVTNQPWSEPCLSLGLI